MHRRLRMLCCLAAALGLLVQVSTAQVASAQPAAASTRIVIADVELTGASQLPETIRSEMMTGLRGRAFQSDTDLAGYLDFAVRGAWQDHGYFKVKMAFDHKVIRENAGQRLIAVTLRVEEGRQYRLREVRFDKHTVFTDEELRALFPLRPGDIFHVAQVRRGLEAIRNLYGAAGYKDMLIQPLLETNDETGEILLRLELEEGARKAEGAS